MDPSPRRPALIGRRRECEALDRLLASLGGGQSRALVIRAEAGIGKSALLDYTEQRAIGARVLRANGVESEMEMAYAGLQQLLAPLLDGLSALPEPQADALGVAFGLRIGEVPGRFVVGLAALNLLADSASSRPVLCLIDDAQWLDEASAQVLAFVARRVVAESVGLVFAVREPVGFVYDGIEELVVSGLDDADSRRLLDRVIAGPVDGRIRDRIIVETRGNPLALIELPRGSAPMEFSSGSGLATSSALARRIEDSFVERIRALPAETRQLLLTAALEPIGDPALVLSAAGSQGLGAGAIHPATDADLLDLGATVRFRHPLVRSAAIRARSLEERQAAHRALAEATDEQADPDRRAWHLAEATIGFDEDVASELVRSARRAQSRGGMVAGAAFHARAVELTPDPQLRSRRALMAAEDTFRAGAIQDVERLLESADRRLLDGHQQARVDLVRACITANTAPGRDASRLLLDAARKLEPHDGETALATYAIAVVMALTAGVLANRDGIPDVAAAILDARPAEPLNRSARAAADALQGFAVLVTEGYTAAGPILRPALAELVAGLREEGLAADAAAADPGRGLGGDLDPAGSELRWLPFACVIARVLLDDEALDFLTERQFARSQANGDIALMPLAAAERVSIQVLSGRIVDAEALADEARPILEAVGMPDSIGGWVATFRGDEADKVASSEPMRSHTLDRGEGQWLVSAAWQDALLLNSLGRYADALTATRSAAAHPFDIGYAGWLLTEHIEAAVRAGSPEQAQEPMARLRGLADAAATDWALGVAARSAALLAADDDAEALYREAIERLAATRIAFELGRAELLYGEWLRRRNRRVEARGLLRRAYDRFSAMGSAALAERARRELNATGEVVNRPATSPVDALTVQERQIALLAAGGSTNPEIGVQLYLSPRTVEWHLRKVFGKLDITSRRQLAGALRVAQPSG